MTTFKPKKRSTKLVTLALVVSILLTSFPLAMPSPAQAQDIIATCKNNPGVDPPRNITSNTLSNPEETANAQAEVVVIGGQLLQVVGIPVSQTAFGSILGMLNVVPVWGQVVAAITWVSYMVMTKIIKFKPIQPPGPLMRGPENYALVGIGYGSDDNDCWIDFEEGEIQPNGTVQGATMDPRNRPGARKKACYQGGGDDSGMPMVYVPEGRYAVGWTFVGGEGWTWGMRTNAVGGGKGWKNYDDSNPELPCYFQMFRKVDAQTGMLVGPILGWYGKGDPADNLDPNDYNGTCPIRGYGAGTDGHSQDLKATRFVSDLETVNPANVVDLNHYFFNPSNRGCQAQNGTFDWNICQGEAPVVDFPIDPPPSRRVIIGARLNLGDDGDVYQMCLAYNADAKIKVRSFKTEAPDTDLALPFTLVGPSPSATGSKTVYENEHAKFGTYTLTVPTGTNTLYPGYKCSLVLVDSSLTPPPTEPTNNPTSTLTDTGATTDCTKALSGILDAIKSPGADGMEFHIKFEKSACVPKSCTGAGSTTSVVAGGAECGKFPNGCDECVEGDASKQAGCLDCGLCQTSGAVCSAEGKCIAPLDATCYIQPSTITAGETAHFAITTQNGTGPYTCAWQSEIPAVASNNSCDFDIVVDQNGVFQSTVNITDSSSPPKSAAPTCTLRVNAPQPTVTPPPPAEVPNYALCEAYKVMMYYGIPLFAIMVVIGGLFLALAMGDPRRVMQGKQVLTAGVVGLVVLIFSKPIFVALLTFFGFQLYLCGALIP